MTQTAEVRKRSPSVRLVELDILRGFLLLWMTLTHLPTKASTISNQTFGFVSGAEGFIFLSGFMIGQLEARIESRSGRDATRSDLFKRLTRVYVYHAVLLVITFTVFAFIAVHFHRPSLQNLLSFYFAHPLRAVAAAAVLRYRPSLLDILPMYVIFLAVTPVARRIARRWSWDPVVYASFLVWAAAQFGLRDWVYSNFAVFRLGVPKDSIGAFDMFAWQLLWIVGLALGSIYWEQLVEAHQEQPALLNDSDRHMPRSLITASLLVAAVFFVLRYSSVERWMNPGLYGWLIDKWHLGPARVINFAALTIVVVRYGQKIAAALPFVQPLALLGRASIEVFSVHVLCCLAGDSLSPDADPNLPWWQQIPLLLFTVAALFATGYWQQRSRDGEKARSG